MGWIAETWRGIMAPEEIKYSGNTNNDLRAKHNAEEIVTKPRLASVTRAPSREAFDAWREHPVTLFAFAALARAAKEQEAAWAGTSWEGGYADQNLLNELRVRADAYKSLEEADYEAFLEWAGVEEPK